MLMDEGDPETGDRRAMQFLRQARALRGLSPVAVQRIGRELERGQVKRRPRPLLFAVAVVAIALVAGATFAAARVGWRNLPFARSFYPSTGHQPKPQALENPQPSNSVGTATASALVDPSSVAPAIAEVAASPTPTPTSNPKRAASSRKLAIRSVRDETSPSTSEVPSSAADSILEEGRSFAAALERWHRDRSGAAALAALDVHERRFPAGRLLVETRLLRAEILLAQGQQRESLALLDQVRLAGSPRARELFTVRGELRIKFGRCADGRADLDEVLRKGVGDSFAKRATETLAHCP